MYGTTDLATILDRKRSFDPSLVHLLSSTSARPTISRSSSAPPTWPATPSRASLNHVGFGTMNGTDGKPFKTREGGVLKLNDMIEMTRTKARERLRMRRASARTSSADRFRRHRRTRSLSRP